MQRRVQHTGSARWLLPVPGFEEIGDGQAKAGEQMLTVAGTSEAHDTAFGARMADFHELFFGMDDPDNLAASLLPPIASE